MGQRKKSVEGREAAKRLLKLKRSSETLSDFARRLGVTPQNIDHWKARGLSLDKLAEMSPRLSEAEVLYVVGRPKNARQPAASLLLPKPSTLADLRDWLDRVREATSVVEAPSEVAAARARAEHEALASQPEEPPTHESRAATAGGGHGLGAGRGGGSRDTPGTSRLGKRKGNPPA